MKLKIILLALLLTACSHGSHHDYHPGPQAPNWEIGPWVHGKNHSIGMPDHPTMQGAGWTFAFAGPSGKVDYVQWKNPPSLVGVKAITIHYTVTGGGFTPYEQPSEQPLVGLEIQRRGDDWSGKGKFQSYRWYGHPRPVLAAGDYTLTIPLEVSEWTDVYGKNDNPLAFASTIAELDNIAIVFGWSAGAGHGVYATEPSTFTLTDITLDKP